jgi:V8-like Glu-specific endopeptidase
MVRSWSLLLLLAACCSAVVSAQKAAAAGAVPARQQVVLDKNGPVGELDTAQSQLLAAGRFAHDQLQLRYCCVASLIENARAITHVFSIMTHPLLNCPCALYCSTYDHAQIAL